MQRLIQGTSLVYQIPLLSLQLCIYNNAAFPSRIYQAPRTRRPVPPCEGGSQLWPGHG